MNSKISDYSKPAEIFDDLPPIVSLDDFFFQETDKIKHINNIPRYIPPPRGIDFSEVDPKKKYILGALPTIEPVKKSLNNSSKFLKRMKKKSIYTKKKKKEIVKRYLKNKKHIFRALPTIKAVKKYLNNPSKFCERMKKISIYTKEEKKGIVERYLKKKLRNKQKIRYPCRQRFANVRPRVGGHFCSQAQINIINLFPDLKNKADKGISISKKEFEEAKKGI